MPFLQPKLIEPPRRARLAEFGSPEFDENDAVAAQQAMADVLSRYPTLVVEEMAKLRAAWNAAPATLDRTTIDPSFGIAHDLVSYGDTFQFPLVTVFARSLCRLFLQGDLTRSEMRPVVEAHIATLDVVVREKVRGNGGTMGLSLAESIDRAIEKFSLGSSAGSPTRLRDEVGALPAAL